MGPAEVAVCVHGSALGAHPGAEVAGVVEEAGEAAREWLGRAVVVPRLLPCGECGLCVRGQVASCPAQQRRGRLEEYERVPVRYLLPLGPPLLTEAIPAGEVWRYAALADALAAPYAGLCRAGISPGEMCVVIGGGWRAGAAVAVIRALGCHAVVLAPRPEDRERLCAPPFGAVAALDSTTLDPEGARDELRGIAMRLEVPAPRLCVLETTGTDAGRARAVALLAEGGTAVLLDRSTPPGLAAPLPAGPALGGPAVLQRLCEEQAAVLGAGAAHPDLLPELLALVVRGALELSALTIAIPPEELEAVLARRRCGLPGKEGLLLPVVRFH
ncbi:MAG: alcohol dehydrogenase catalytic domain-containing protein [Myxococcales bacterium]|nr:alcohol dehydrogenase catalytic domain-containing protein [Myxococcota bacterium]MDW8283201.1 alcohol dehydrogenase catalytic domain-containing protein [Myxococcales bacterium]